MKLPSRNRTSMNGNRMGSLSTKYSLVSYNYCSYLSLCDNVMMSTFDIRGLCKCVSVEITNIHHNKLLTILFGNFKAGL